MNCDYCGRAAELVGGDVIYPHRPDLKQKQFWRCVPCDARTGCHGNTSKPMGRLANPELRRWKMAAHEAFDQSWKNGRAKRTDAYLWLGKQMGLLPEETHIGLMNVEQCKEVVQLMKKVRFEP